MSKILSRADLDFFLYEWLDVESLPQRERYSEHSRKTFDDFLDLSERLATREFATHNSLGDRNEPTFDGQSVRIIPEVKRALDAFNAAGLVSAGMDEELGGVQLPKTVERACHMWFQAANTATSGYSMLTIGAANLLAAHASPELAETFLPGLLDGRSFGIMCLSEPDVGSSLGDVATHAVLQEDGSHRVFGTKMWISGGDHELSENIVGLVLARYQGGPAGVRGLSLYVVPKFLVNADGSIGERNAVALVGVNHKMGYRGTVNTILEFGGDSRTPMGAPGAIGYLVGEEGNGLAYMFHLMNEARISVGAGAAALGVTSYLHALDYARNRTQGRLAGAGSSSPMVPIIRHPDVRRMLLASKAYTEGALALVLYGARLLDDQLTAPTEEERTVAGTLLDVLTPAIKSWPAQWCLVANDHAIQVHGGYGYTREFPVEQFYRDNRLNQIHEGTHGIQGKDLLGRKVVMNDGEGLRLLLERIERSTDAARATHPEWAAALERLCVRLNAVTHALHAIGDPETALANATVYLEATGHIVVAWLWLDIVTAITGRTGPLYDGKRLAAGYFFEYEVPRISPMLDLLESCSTTLVDLDDSLM